MPVESRNFLNLAIKSTLDCDSLGEEFIDVLKNNINKIDISYHISISI